MGIEGIGGPGSFGGGAGRMEHAVQKGDTLESIARQHGMTTDGLLNANPHLKELELKPGMVVEIVPPGDQAGAVGPESPVGGDSIDRYEPYKLGFDPQPDPKFLYGEHQAIRPDTPQVQLDGKGGRLDAAFDIEELKANVASSLNFSLTSDQFKINEQGRLTIQDDRLNRFFHAVQGKTLPPGPETKESEAFLYSLAQGSDEPNQGGETEAVLVGLGSLLGETVPEGDALENKATRFTKLEALEYKVGSAIEFKFEANKPLSLEMQDFHVNERGESVITNEQVGKLFQSVLDRQSPGETIGLNFSISTKAKGE